MAGLDGGYRRSLYFLYFSPTLCKSLRSDSSRVSNRTDLGHLLDVFASSFAIIRSKEGSLPFLQISAQRNQEYCCLRDGVAVC